jgi:hypothetical protein
MTCNDYEVNSCGMFNMDSTTACFAVNCKFITVWTWNAIELACLNSY